MLRSTHSFLCFKIGLVGSGRRSVAKMAAYLKQLQWFEIVVDEKESSWKKQLQQVVRSTLTSGKGTVLYVDHQQLSQVTEKISL